MPGIKKAMHFVVTFFNTWWIYWQAFILNLQSTAMTLEVQLKHILGNTHEINKRLAVLSVEKNELNRKIGLEESLVKNNVDELKTLETLIPG